MRRKKNISGRKDERGVVITLVAIFMLFVIGAMAALSIDVVTIYTARSEAQLAADGAALAAARVIANSGATSADATGTMLASVEAAGGPVQNVATQVAQQNQVGGIAPNIAFVFGGTTTNPTVTVKVQVTTLPTFFARIWGTKFITVAASATAEAYNPSGVVGTTSTTKLPVAPLCVKPWLLPNIDPTQSSATGNPIFVEATGAIFDATLVGKGWPNAINTNGIYSLCSGDCSTGSWAPAPGAYYPGAIDSADFPVPTQGLPTGVAGFNPYQLAIAACVPTPILCGANSSIKIDTTPYSPSPTGTRDGDTVAAADILIHYVSSPGDSDSIDTTSTPPPFQFLGGNQNPVAGAFGQDVMVSDSLVTIPVIDYPGTPPPPTVANPSVNVIGFLQVFLNPSASSTMPYAPAGPASPNEISATIINMAGCGTGATGQPILGNGASPVAVRLISPP